MPVQRSLVLPTKAYSRSKMVFEGKFSVRFRSFARGAALLERCRRVWMWSMPGQLRRQTVQGTSSCPWVTPVSDATLTDGEWQQHRAITSLERRCWSVLVPICACRTDSLRPKDPLTGRLHCRRHEHNPRRVVTLDCEAGSHTSAGLVRERGATPGASVTLVSGNFRATTTATPRLFLMTGSPKASLWPGKFGYGFSQRNIYHTVSGDGRSDPGCRSSSSGTVAGRVVMADGVTPAPPPA